MSERATEPRRGDAAPGVDVIVVSYNSRRHLRGCVEPLTHLDGVRVVVVDNDSRDGSLDSIRDLPVVAIAAGSNGGFAKGCNRGWREGSAPYALFLNPDARLAEGSLRRLVDVLERDGRAGLVGPKILDEDGALDFSQRYFPTLRSRFAVALYLHHLFGEADWIDGVVHSRERYERPGTAEWISGACILARRSLLERLGGFDERFFMYCEDLDLCRRTWDLGLEVRFEPGAVATHVGGASAPKPATVAILAESRVRYAKKHHGPLRIAADRLGLALVALSRVAVVRGGGGMRAAHVRALRVIASGGRIGAFPAPRPRAAR